MSSVPVLNVRSLEISLSLQQKSWKAVRDVSFTIAPSEILCLVGESGCGKSITALSIPRLLPSPPAKISHGSIEYQGKNLLAADHKEMQAMRGKEIGFIFQDPMTSLNPVLSIETQLRESVAIHQPLTGVEIRQKVDHILEEVGIPPTQERKGAYPHELSGGMRQRIMIAMALINNPQLLIADEPTTALDVTIQSQILDLIHDLQAKHRMSILLITHDLGIVYEMADKVAVMYAGQIVEIGSCAQIFSSPKHPYTQALQKVLPGLHAIPGQVPTLFRVPSYCAFYDRCPQATEECKRENPVLREIEPGQSVRCIKA